MLHRTLLALAIALPTTAMAQHHHGPAGQAAGGHGQPNPYGDFQKREIKALSETEVSDLTAGRGMAMAVPAELNSYPGPMHALELADKLGLSPDQRAALQQQMHGMRLEAIPAGAAVIEAERRLDRLFASGVASDPTVAAAVAAAAEARSNLRLVHLRTHIKTRATLTTEQVELYKQLRGYTP